MIEYIYKCADYLILNGYSVKSTGLYNGKTGISLCLFELAHYLKDGEIEKHAFELLQESLILSSKKKDISFKNGLSGVGFVLLYLIKNQLIDADFEELFEDCTNNILNHIENSKESQDLLFLVYFLELLFQSNKKKKIKDYSLNILRDVEKKLLLHIDDFELIDSKLVKCDFLKDFTNYLKIISINEYQESSFLITRYCKLFEKGKIASNIEITFYLNQINYNSKINNEWFNNVSAINEKEALLNLEVNHSRFILSERLNTLYLLNKTPEKYNQHILLLEDSIFDTSSNKFQEKLLNGIPRNKYIPGYEFGIARFLIYCVYKKLKNEKKDISRFNLLFI